MSCQKNPPRFSTNAQAGPGRHHVPEGERRKRAIMIHYRPRLFVSGAALHEICEKSRIDQPMQTLSRFGFFCTPEA